MSVSKKKFKGEVALWSAKIKVSPRRVTVRPMTRKWGSCSSDGRVCFNSDLLSKPPSFRRFVIAHELLHLKIPNHGGLFKQMLSAHIPGWRKIRASQTLRGGRG